MISYAELLEIFWNSHDPTSQPGSRQYMSIIFYHSEGQEKAAALKETVQGRLFVPRSSPFRISTSLRTTIRSFICKVNRYFLMNTKPFTRKLASLFDRLPPPESMAIWETTAVLNLSRIILILWVFHRPEMKNCCKLAAGYDIPPSLHR